MTEDASAKLVQEIRRLGLCGPDALREAFEAIRVAKEVGVRARIEDVLVEKGFVAAKRIRALKRSLSPKPEWAEIAGYEILDQIGKGGMGAVYRARQKVLNRVVALKVLSPALAADPHFVHRFQREARLAARLNHPNLVQVFNVGRDQGKHYIAMEFVQGQSVAAIVRGQGPLPESEAAEIAAGAAAALAAAAERGVVHRDVKPSNILISPSGVPKLTDLGLAKSAEDDAGLTRAGAAVGTPQFMSPEQAKGVRVPDVRSDLYSLGATLYFMLTGRPPFSGASHFDTLRKHVDEPPTPPEQVRPGVSPAMSAVVMKMLEKEPSNRYQTPAEAIAALREAVSRKGAMAPDADAVPAERPASPGVALDQGAGRRLWLWMAWAAATGILIGTAFFVAGGAKRGERPPAPVAAPAVLSVRPMSNLPQEVLQAAQVEILASWGGPGDGRGQFREPSGVSVSPAGEVFVADRWNHRVKVFDEGGGYLAEWGGEGRGPERFFAPLGLAFEPSGGVRVADTGRAKVVHFSVRGTFLGAWGQPGWGDGDLARPAGIAFAPDGSVVVAEELNRRVQVFRPDGQWLRTIEGDAHGRPLFAGPRAVAVDSRNRCYVADAAAGRVVAFDLGADEIEPVNMDIGPYARPSGVCVDEEGRVFVSDARNRRICVLVDGELAAAWGRPGTEEGALARPEGLACDGGGVVYVADAGANRVLKLRFEFPPAP